MPAPVVSAHNGMFLARKVSSLHRGRSGRKRARQGGTYRGITELGSADQRLLKASCGVLAGIVAVCLASWAALLAAGASTPSGMTHKTKSLLVLKLQQLPNTFLERSTTVSSFTQKSICHPAGVPVGLGYPAVALGTARDPGVACPGSVSRLTHSFHALFPRRPLPRLGFLPCQPSCA